MTGEGRSRCFVGGVTVPVRSLAALGERLVSYHGQREQARLTEPAEQLSILDDFLDEGAARAKAELAQLWRSVEKDREELAEIRATSEARLREVDFLRYQVSEIEEAGYEAQEMANLSRERDRLRNVTDLMAGTEAATEALSSEDGAMSAVASRRRRDGTGHQPRRGASRASGARERALGGVAGRGLRTQGLFGRVGVRPWPPGGR